MKKLFLFVAGALKFFGLVVGWAILLYSGYFVAIVYSLLTKHGMLDRALLLLFFTGPFFVFWIDYCSSNTKDLIKATKREETNIQ